MNTQELNAITYQLGCDVSRAETKARDVLEGQFVPPDSLSNEDSDTAFTVNSFMITHTILSFLLAPLKKRLDTCKIGLDTGARLLGGNPDPVEGVETLVHKSNMFQFLKRQNAGSTTCSAKDLMTELYKAGMDRDIVEKAFKAASKERRGNVYYEVQVVE